MGDRTRLSFGNYCEIEANNCVPVTWLALFTDDEFDLKEEFEGGDEEFRYFTAIFKTTRYKALQRAEIAISQLKNTPAWALLKPIEILRKRLKTRQKRSSRANLPDEETKTSLPD
jgi:hypothetical protein